MKFKVNIKDQKKFCLQIFVHLVRRKNYIYLPSCHYLLKNRKIEQKFGKLRKSKKTN